VKFLGSLIEGYELKIKNKDVVYPKEFTINVGDRFPIYWDTYGYPYINICIGPLMNELKDKGYTKATVNFGATIIYVYYGGTRYTLSSTSYYANSSTDEFKNLCDRGAISLAQQQSTWSAYDAAMYVEGGISITVSK